MFLPQDLKGQLILVHVNPELKGRSEATTVNAEKDPILAPAVASAKQESLSYKCVVATGKPSEGICRLAEELNVDLLIPGSPKCRSSISKDLPDLDRLLGASLSYYVHVQATCPVLLPNG